MPAIIPAGVDWGKINWVPVQGPTGTRTPIGTRRYYFKLLSISVIICRSEESVKGWLFLSLMTFYPSGMIKNRTLVTNSISKAGAWKYHFGNSFFRYSQVLSEGGGTGEYSGCDHKHENVRKMFSLTD